MCDARGVLLKCGGIDWEYSLGVFVCVGLLFVFVNRDVVLEIWSKRSVCLYGIVVIKINFVIILNIKIGNKYGRSKKV